MYIVKLRSKWNKNTKKVRVFFVVEVECILRVEIGQTDEFAEHALIEIGEVLDVAAGRGARTVVEVKGGEEGKLLVGEVIALRADAAARRHVVDDRVDVDAHAHGIAARHHVSKVRVAARAAHK